MDYLIFFILFVLFLPRRLFASLSIKPIKIEALLFGIIVFMLSIYSIEEGDYIYLCLNLSIVFYLTMFNSYSGTLSTKIINTIKLYNIGNIKKIKNIIYPATKIFYFIKVSLIIVILEYLLLSSYFSYTLFLFTLLLLLGAVSILKSKSINIQNLIDSKCKLALNSLEPKIVFYFSAANNNFLYHIKMWLPYIKNTNVNFMIMVRESKYLAKLKQEVDDIPIVLAKSMKDIEFFLPESVKIVLYANNGAKNTHLVRFNHLTHIQLLHGDSEKPPSFNPVSKIYDKLFVSGQRAIDRYYENGVNIDKNNFTIIGRPQVSNIEIADSSVNNIKTILIAPTWQGFHKDTEFSSLYALIPIIEFILSKQNIKIIFRKHPLTNIDTAQNKEYFSKIEKLLHEDKIEHLFCSDRDIIDDFNESDCIITDISSVPIDYLYSTKAILHYDINELSTELKTNIIYKRYAEAVYIIDKEYTNLDQIFNDLTTVNSLHSKRIEIKEYYHSKFDSPLDEVFTKKILELL